MGYLRYAQQKSISQDGGNQWGVHFENPANGDGFYSLYSGTSYSSPQETRYLPGGLEFQLPSSDNAVDISFSKLTGQNYTDTEQEVIIHLIGSQIAQVIRAIPNGVMTSGGGEKGYWKFDEGVGNSVADETIYKNTGTLVNSPTWKVSSNCISGTCLEFNGSTNYAIVDNNFIVNPTSLTISAWFKKIGEGSNYECVLHKGSDTTIGNSEYWLGVDSNDYLTATIGARTGVGWAAGQTTTKATLGVWYYLSASWDGSVVRVYIDGKYIKQYDLLLYSSLTTPTRFGASSNGANYQFNGLIDEVRIYNRALSAEEIIQHYKARE